jgi:hypothetical protein
VVGTGFADLYDPDQDVWTPSLRDRSFVPDALFALSDGRVLSVTSYPARSRLFDEKAGRWFAASAPTGRRSPVFASLGDGRVLVAGGMNCSGNDDESCFMFSSSTRSVEIYTPPPPRPRVISRSLVGYGRARSIVFTLNESATVRMVLARRLSGAWREMRYGRRRQARLGRNRIPLAGRLDLRGLPAGRYRLNIFIRDAFGRTGSPAPAEFRLT